MTTKIDLISTQGLHRHQVLDLLSLAGQFKQQAANKTVDTSQALKGKIVASCFFEASTRTRLSFETAAIRLGAQIIGFASDAMTSISKGETLQDSIRMVSYYADLIVIRHPKEGSAQLAAKVSNKPVINAGDGSNQHPTQALTDLLTIQACQPQLEGLSIALVGDLKYSRTIRSLVQLCALFKMRLFLVSPPALSLAESICDELKWQGVRFSHHQALSEVIPRVDILYMTRIQQERLSGNEQFLFKEQPFCLTPTLLQQAQSHLKVLHPLPRLNEIDLAVDQTPHAYYFTQAENGLYMRQAVLEYLA